jgi:rSAM/selenodomain-associated transferase 1
MIAKQHLIIFTRYPEAGKTKTRMIDALGEQGAADLQKQMTEYTVSQVIKLQKTSAITVEIRFTGGNTKLMENWLGSDFIYQPQGEGDLGKRMLRSLTDAFANNTQEAIIIGTDCPGVNLPILRLAFEQLQKCDVVLGPALDGGYYLIGVRQAIPHLFNEITWGTSQVFTQTVEIIRNLNLSTVYLPSLADVDRPEDLPVWLQVFCQ